jgi:hypothetical protein
MIAVGAVTATRGTGILPVVRSRRTRAGMPVPLSAPVAAALCRRARAGMPVPLSAPVAAALCRRARAGMPVPLSAPAPSAASPTRASSPGSPATLKILQRTEASNAGFWNLLRLLTRSGLQTVVSEPIKRVFNGIERITRPPFSTSAVVWASCSSRIGTVVRNPWAGCPSHPEASRAPQSGAATAPRGTGILPVVRSRRARAGMPVPLSAPVAAALCRRTRAGMPVPLPTEASHA